MGEIPKQVTVVFDDGLAHLEYILTVMYCKDCVEPFAALSDYEDGETICPYCGSKDTVICEELT